MAWNTDLQTYKRMRSWKFFLVILATFHSSAEAISQKEYEFPSFYNLPPSEMFASYEDDTVSFSISVYPTNVTLSLGVLNTTTDQLDFLSSLVQFQPTLPDKTKIRVTFRDWRPYIGRNLHIRATDNLGSRITRPLIINTYKMKDFPEEQHEDVSFFVGNIGHVSCNLPDSSPTQPEMIFLKDGVILNTDKKSRYRSLFIASGLNKMMNNRMVLLIDNVKMRDAGKYTCMAKVGTILKKGYKNTIIKVKKSTSEVKPKLLFKGPTQNITLRSGTDVTLYCVGESVPPKPISWFVKPSHNLYRTDSSFYTLTITNVTAQHSATYACNAGEDTLVIFNLTVLAEMRMTVSPEHIQVPCSNQEVDLDCKIQPPQSFLPSLHGPYIPHWVHNGRFIQSNDMYNITRKTNTALLKIFDPNKSAGIYQCYGVDSMGRWVDKAVSIVAGNGTLIKEHNFVLQVKSMLKARNQPLRFIRLVAKTFFTHIRFPSIPDEKWNQLSCFQILPKKRVSLEDNNYYVLKINEKPVLSIIDANASRNNGLFLCEFSKPNFCAEEYFEIEVLSRMDRLKDVSAIRGLPYFPAVFIHWTFVDFEEAKEPLHIRIELTRSKETPPPLVAPSRVELVGGIIPPNATNFTLDDSTLLIPGYFYRFRVILVDAIDSYKSNWTTPISFHDIDATIWLEIDSINLVNFTKIQAFTSSPNNQSGIYLADTSILNLVCRLLNSSSPVAESNLALWQNTPRAQFLTLQSDSMNAPVIGGTHKLPFDLLEASVPYGTNRAVELAVHQSGRYSCFVYLKYGRTKISFASSPKLIDVSLKSSVLRIDRKKQEDDNLTLVAIVLGSVAAILLIILVLIGLGFRYYRRSSTKRLPGDSLKVSTQQMSNLNSTQLHPNVMYPGTSPAHKGINQGNFWPYNYSVATPSQETSLVSREGSNASRDHHTPPQGGQPSPHQQGQYDQNSIYSQVDCDNNEPFQVMKSEQGDEVYLFPMEVNTAYAPVGMISMHPSQYQDFIPMTLGRANGTSPNPGLHPIGIGSPPPLSANQMRYMQENSQMWAMGNSDPYQYTMKYAPPYSSPMGPPIRPHMYAPGVPTSMSPARWPPSTLHHASRASPGHAGSTMASLRNGSPSLRYPQETPVNSRLRPSINS